MSEHDAQAAMFKTIKMMEGQRPELALLFAIPNGGHRHVSVAKKLKDEGVKAGVLDTMLPVARGGWHGLFIEMKAGRNKPTPAQTWWIEQLKAQGFYCTVHWEWTNAIETLIDYLDGRIKRANVEES